MLAPALASLQHGGASLRFLTQAKHVTPSGQSIRCTRQLVLSAGQGFMAALLQSGHAYGAMLTPGKCTQQLVLSAGQGSVAALLQKWPRIWRHAHPWQMHSAAWLVCRTGKPCCASSQWPSASPCSWPAPLLSRPLTTWCMRSASRSANQMMLLQCLTLLLGYGACLC